MAIAEAMRNSAPAMAGRALPGPNDYAQIPELAARGQARLAYFLARFETHMTGREWVAIDSFSLADITAGVDRIVAARSWNGFSWSSSQRASGYSSMRRRMVPSGSGVCSVDAIRYADGTIVRT